ncbi:MAG: hypothetical protein M3279_05555 [Actinomycetota bacterium]|nr:hypothetical protein [Actinomycetota bacterium]
MNKVAAVLTAGLVSFGGLSIAATPAHACVGVQCAISCVQRILAGERVCPD